MSEKNGSFTLSENDIAFIMSLLKTASAPLTTATLIEAFRKRNAG